MRPKVRSNFNTIPTVKEIDQTLWTFCTIYRFSFDSPTFGERSIFLVFIRDLVAIQICFILYFFFIIFWVVLFWIVRRGLLCVQEVVTPFIVYYYCVSRKYSNLYNELLYKLGNYFLDIGYIKWVTTSWTNGSLN